MSNKYRVPDIKWHLKNIYKRLFFTIWSIYNPFVEIKSIKIPVKRSYSIPMLESLRAKSFESGELNIIEKTIHKDDLVLELGTGLGLLSAFCAKKIGNQKVYTIEANIRIKNAIQELYVINNVQPHIDYRVAGLSDEIVTFYYEPKDIWSSSTIKLSKTSKPIDVKEINCNDLLNNLKPNYLIIDIEGGEYHLLPKLNLNSVKKLQIEFHPKHIGQTKIDELINYLTSIHFKIDANFTTSEQYYFYR